MGHISELQLKMTLKFSLARGWPETRSVRNFPIVENWHGQSCREGRSMLGKVMTLEIFQRTPVAWTLCRSSSSIRTERSTATSMDMQIIHHLSTQRQLCLKTASDLKASDRSERVDCATEFDVLGFWVSMKALTPILSRIALRYLSVPMNSVDAER